MKTTLVLASASPRRAELLHQVGLDFICIASQADESFSDKYSPEENLIRNAARKARDVLGRAPGDSVILGADTVVSARGRVLGKPKDEPDAFAMLSLLSGRAHTVYTAFSLVEKGSGRCISRCVGTDVVFRPLSAEEISRYVQSGEPMDKAGAYGIQGLAAAFVREIRGEYTNVVGLPLCALAEALKEYGF